MVSLRVKAANIKHAMFFNSLVVSKSVPWHIGTMYRGLEVYSSLFFGTHSKNAPLIIRAEQNV
jgi:hypothetical protein